MTTALVTGAGVGIGAAFCRELARTGHDLVVVSRTASDLESLAAALRTSYGVHVEVLPADLADRAQVEAVAERVRSRADPIDLLVNNAGFGHRDGFLDHPVEQEELALDVMGRAVLVLSHAAGQAMRTRGRGAILNVSSVAGFIPMGHYSAVKAYVTSLSEGLAAELAGSGVHVMALCPGFTRTQFHQRAALNMSFLPEAAWLDADRLVRDALDDLRRGRTVSVPGPHYRALVSVARHAPQPLLRRLSPAWRARRRR